MLDKLKAKLFRFKQVKNYKIYLLMLVFLIITSVGIGSLFLFQDKPKASLENNYHQIVEPVAPLSSQFQSTEIVTSNETKVTNILKINSDSPTRIQIEKKNPEQDSGDLNLIDSKNKIISIDNNVTNVGFISNDNIYYQKINSNNGIFTYDLINNKKTQALETTDESVFDNIVFVDANRFFFIQPNTGKIGFNSVSDNKIIILDQKLLQEDSNYIQSSAYKLAGISPDKKFITFFDLTSQQNGLVKLIILPSTATSIKDVYFSTNISSHGRSISPDEKIFTWSNDGKYLVVGDNSSVIDIVNKNIVSSIENKLVQSKFSPDSTKIMSCNFTDNECDISSLHNNLKKKIAEDVSQFEWLNNDQVVFIVGKRLYTYTISIDKLEMITDEKADFKILDTDSSTSSIFISINGTVKEFTLKK